jgi:hypothetical protein
MLRNINFVRRLRLHIDARNQGNLAWSKDYVEHLRTVHFAMIVVAVALIALVFSAKEYNSLQALVEIEQIIELRKVWSPQWIEQNSDKNHNVFVHWGTNYGSQQPQTKMFVRVEKSRRKGLKVGNLFVLDLPKSEDEVRFYRVRERRYYPQLSPIPNNLANFRSWWTSIAEPTIEVLPRFLSSKCSFRPESYFDVPVAACRILGSGTLDDRYRASRIERVIKASYNSKLSIDGVDLPTIGSNGKLTFSDNMERHYEDLELQLEGRDKLSNTQFVAEVSDADIFIVDRAIVAAAFFNSRNGEFKDVFRDLIKAARGMEFLELEDIKKHLAESVGKEENVFEMFGVKFPADQITFWGAACLVACQIYFCLYLKQRVGNLSHDADAWQVPWIGMDHSIMARILFFVTLVLIPASAILLLCGRASGLVEEWNGGLNPWRWDWTGEWSWGVLVRLETAIAVSMYLGLLSWKYRPSIRAMKSHGIYDEPREKAATVSRSEV